MDIKATAEKLIKQITGNKDLLANFKKNPLDTVKGLLKVDLPADDLSKVVDIVKAKVDVDEAKDKATGIASKIKGLFGKK